MPIKEPLGREECRSLLAPHMHDLEQCFKLAWERWQRWLLQLDGSPGDVKPRSRASTLYDFIVAAATSTFLGKPDVFVSAKSGLLILKFNDRIALRFKKFTGKTLRISRNKTNQARAFDLHQLELSDEVLQPITHVVAGYLLDELASGIDRLAITCSVDGEQFWAPIDIEKQDVMHTDVVHNVVTSDPTSAKPTVRSKRQRPAANSEGD